MSNEAAWLREATADLEVGPAEMYKLEADEVLVKVSAICLNPIDYKVVKQAIFPLQYPTIVGWSFGGVIEELGSSVTSFKVGNRVAAMQSPKMRSKAEAGGYQKYALADPATLAKLDNNTSVEDAVASVGNVATIACALGSTSFMNLDKPPVTSDDSKPNPSNKDKKILVYGGSSSVGNYAIQYAVQAGYTVVTTSSPASHSRVEALGPIAVVSHKQSEEVIVQELAAHGPYARVFDTTGKQEVGSILTKVFGKKGGSYTGVISGGTPVELPENVERKAGSFPFELYKPENAELNKWVYEKYLPIGLASGKIIPTTVEKVHGGLGAIQGALERVAAGEPGKKLVVVL
ncbi:GroES-like protein [Aulographum hederae CBS 113979]|uniref:GroES-like protein n=1 Tax=Aulographum hederae CBS 113979 TaxID=1176131 RepID=A0A6G1H5Q5_9PEZI|nr:GroES-like protein [Aulographum hederae CBS 113979]